MTTVPRTGFVRVGELVVGDERPSSLRPKAKHRSRGPQTCPSGKKRYASESDALGGLMGVRKARAAAGHAEPPECRIYWCERCIGWHLTSTELNGLELKPVRARMTDETWEKYAKRLERRIAEQRAQILSLVALGHGASNREARKRTANLVVALGRMTERWEIERQHREALVRQVEELRARRGFLTRLRSRRKPGAVTPEAVSPHKEKRSSVA